MQASDALLPHSVLKWIYFGENKLRGKEKDKIERKTSETMFKKTPGILMLGFQSFGFLLRDGWG